MFPQEWTPYGIFGYRTRWRWTRTGGVWLAVAISVGLWAGLIAAAIGIAR